MSERVCSLCGEPIRDGQMFAWQIVGYEYERSQGGTNAIRLRRRTGNLAHRFCVEKEKTVGAFQGSLIEVPSDPPGKLKAPNR